MNYVQAEIMMRVIRNMNIPLNFPLSDLEEVYIRVYDEIIENRIRYWENQKETKREMFARYDYEREQRQSEGY